MTKDEIIKLIESKEVLIVTREELKEAIKEAVSGLLDYEDFHDFSKGVKSVDSEQVICEVLLYLESN
jgi:hypothetical protein